MKRASTEDDEMVFYPPAPNRVRNILTIEERIRAIQAYDQKPMYTKVAKMFNCSWEQIKNIITNRESIMRYHETIKSDINKNLSEQQSEKIEFLQECVFEHIQRVQYHHNVGVTEELIRNAANRFREVLKIKNFLLNKSWLNKFKMEYNISLSNRQVVLTHAPPESLETKDIISYCIKKRTRNAPTTAPVPPLAYNIKPKPTILNSSYTKQTKPSQNDTQTVRKRKIQFLERALWEYLVRVRYHHARSPKIYEIINTANELKQMLKIDDFEPNSSWLKEFREFQAEMSTNNDCQQRPPFSLDLRDILSYCGRETADKHKPPTVKLQPKEKFQLFVPTPNPTTVETIIPESTELEELQEIDEDDDEDVKPYVQQFEQQQNDCQPPPFKIQKVESVAEIQVMAEEHNFQSFSPANGSLFSGNDEQDDNTNLPNQVQNYRDALKLLKPLEEFVMLEANYRAIGLISQLEQIFKNPPKKEEEE